MREPAGAPNGAKGRGRPRKARVTEAAGAPNGAPESMTGGGSTCTDQAGGFFLVFFGVPRSVRAREWRSDAGSRRTVRRGSHPRIQSRWLASRQFGPLVRDPVQSHVNLAQDTGKWSEFVKNGINKTFDTVGFTKLGLSSVFAQVPHPPPLQLSCEFLPPLLESDRQVSFPRDTYLPRNN